MGIVWHGTVWVSFGIKPGINYKMTDKHTTGPICVLLLESPQVETHLMFMSYTCMLYFHCC